MLLYLEGPFTYLTFKTIKTIGKKKHGTMEPTTKNKLPAQQIPI